MRQLKDDENDILIYFFSFSFKLKVLEKENHTKKVAMIIWITKQAYVYPVEI